MYAFCDKIQELIRFEPLLRTHQSRASERILVELLGRPSKVVPNNNHFDTTRANVEHTGAQAIDLVIEEGEHPSSRHPFKGTIDVPKLESLIDQVLGGTGVSPVSQRCQKRRVR